MSQKYSASTSVITDLKEQTSQILSTFLNDCKIKFRHDVQLDRSYRNDCYADAIRRGIDVKLIAHALECGVIIGDTAYRHLENYPTRVFIAVWTGLMVHVDDYPELYVEGLNEFSGRFMRQEPQLHPIFDQLVEMSKEFTVHWEAIQTNLILASQLDFLSSSIIDKMIEGMQVESTMAPGFAQFSRRLSGTAVAYGCQVFPREIDAKEWIHVIPDLLHYINYGNDLFSFYKEELAGEDLNFISISAKTKGLRKIEALKQLTDETAACYRRGTQLLQSSPKALEAFRSFCVGYIDFHAAFSERYKLGELNL